MSGFGDASLIRVTGGPALVLVTIYQAPGSTAEGAPNLQVLPLMGEAPAQAAGASPAPLPAPAKVDVVAHIQTRGDVGAQFGEWLGKQGSGLWIEGFGITPPGGVALTDIEYQVVLGRGWMSPWVEGGQYCGSRGMALPILGLRIRLRGAAAEAFEIRYSASFVDGTTVGPVSGGEPCEADDLVAVEALFLELVPIGKSATEAAPKGRAGGKRR
jgi:hypothetical protein